MAKRKPERKHDKPVFKQLWFWLTLLVVIAIVVVICIGTYTTPGSNQSQQSAPQQANSSDQTPAKTSGTAPDSSVKQRNNKYTGAPKMSIDKGKQYTATVATTLGAFKIKLLSQDAPATVNNFVFLAKDGFYNGIIFHRIIKDFMIQTGDPLGNGTGGPGYKFADELPNKLPYSPGIVAMANSGPNTNGSQFFICTGQQANNLNSKPDYTIFGQVVEGMDVVQKIAGIPVAANSGGEPSKPTENVSIKEIAIDEK